MLSRHIPNVTQVSTTISKRTFIISTLATLTNSQYFKNIQLADEIEDIHNKLPFPQMDEFIQQAREPLHEDRKFPDGRIKLNSLEQSSIFLISGISALLNPANGTHINNFGEVSSFEFVLKNLRDQMLQTSTGRSILRERPLMNNETLDPEWLKTLPENSLGFQYLKFTEDGDSRAPVKLIQDEELAYVFLRYRQTHDIVHILTKSKIDLAGELPVKAFEFGNTGLPMTGLACFAWFKLSDKRKARINMFDSFLNGLQSKPFIGVKWEDFMEWDVEDVRKELGVIPQN
ncbi:hypothetical protein BN7_1169 [Wickerhamomyces ciferrii]|uniref:4-hydroxy-3-methoxy-5-polyprenylbenzoate decarboxylase n=1 Tax=Wickerhamomyces ciferrii (strain ATCC 14091 / BCRC 22168 / CBS 111 / JCM 3599 / NBRC 0793 / NRRL Y-1031 F-60-10) TaxID=1206466 RepID=K0KKI1_WICCF|nr:uncharacterized protein BN7_1169 [Wickerhamomyces ciferrii]CCH41628.1 hypothetical protein BN7_1169 [Wickerhamomyces ciferrii]